MGLFDGGIDVGDLNPLNRKNRGVSFGTAALGGGAVGPWGSINGLTGGAISNGLQQLPIIGSSFGDGGVFGGGDKQMVDTAGERPGMPGFEYNPLNNWGEIDWKYRLVRPDKPFGIDQNTINPHGELNPNSDALNALRSRATATGDSPWLKMQLEKQGLDEAAARDNALATAAGQGAAARSALAMNGGLSSGARERVARDTARNATLAGQGITQQGGLNRLNLQIADDQTKQDLLGKTAGLDLQNAGYQADLAKFNASQMTDAQKFNNNIRLDTEKFDALNTLGAIQKKNEYNLAKYGEQMKGYAAGKSGDAIANGGKK